MRILITKLQSPVGGDGETEAAEGVVFNVKGNNYWLVVAIKYHFQVLLMSSPLVLRCKASFFVLESRMKNVQNIVMLRSFDIAVLLKLRFQELESRRSRNLLPPYLGEATSKLLGNERFLEACREMFRAIRSANAEFRSSLTD